MTKQTIQEYAVSKGFHPQFLQRWLNWNPKDGAALLDIALSLKAGENQLRDLAGILKSQYRLVYARPDSLIPPERVQVSAAKPGLEVRATPARGQDKKK